MVGKCPLDSDFEPSFVFEVREHQVSGTGHNLIWVAGFRNERRNATSLTPWLPLASGHDSGAFSGDRPVRQPCFALLAAAFVLDWVGTPVGGDEGVQVGIGHDGVFVILVMLTEPTNYRVEILGHLRDNLLLHIRPRITGSGRCRGPSSNVLPVDF